MALEQSILNGTKKKLGLDASYTAFDVDVIDYINGAFFKLFQLGLGPSNGFSIEDEEATWEDFDLVGLNISVLNAVKTYINLKVRLIFDPPAAAHHIKAIEDQITELEYTLLLERELKRWPASDSPGLLDDAVVIDGGTP